MGNPMFATRLNSLSFGATVHFLAGYQKLYVIVLAKLGWIHTLLFTQLSPFVNCVTPDCIFHRPMHCGRASGSQANF
jgi:hypothetical protein